LRTYEGMFLLDSAEAVKDWDATVGVVTGILERYGATLQLNGKWDERKLAYPIKKQKRGSYYLAYFDAPSDSIVKMRDDLQLKEEVLRFLILAMPEDVPVPETLDQRIVIEDDDDDRRGGRDGGGGGGFRRDRRDDSNSGGDGSDSGGNG
jgi:small subunit ribosomal protein S6